MKIKCNKSHPCDQCFRRGIPCRFPAKFRNIAIDGEEQQTALAFSDDSGSESEEIIPARSSGSPKDIDSLTAQIYKLKVENACLSERNEELALQAKDSSRSNLIHGRDSIEITGETTEEGEKYYGPQLAHFMIKNLEAVLETEMPSPEMSRKSSSVASSSVSPEDDPSNSKNGENGEVTKRVSARRERMNRSLRKKKLPMILHQRSSQSNGRKFELLVDDPVLALQNKQVITKLVHGFFDRHTYHRSLFSKTDILNFLDGFEAAPDNEWEDDDLLLLVNTMLLSSIETLTPRECVDLGIIPLDGILSYPQFMRHLVKKVLMHNVLELRHNLLNESYVTVAAHILCAEWLFHSHQYEECWSIVFHGCAVLYAIGLHIIGDLRKYNMLVDRQSEDIDPVDETAIDFTRFKLWFGLKYVTGQVCSILGRPNPLSIRATSAIMRSALDLGDVIDDEFERTCCKVGLSECLRLANMMLIESFMMDFNEDDLLELDAKFGIEINVCETILKQAGSNKPIAIVYDLLVLLVNRAKLLHPFLAKFKDKSSASTIVNHMIQSLFQSTKCLLELINLFEKLIRDSLDAEDSLDVEAKTKLAAKQCSARFPFLSQWVHQGLIVVFSHFCQQYRGNTPIIDLITMAELEKNLREALDAGSTIAGWPPKPMAFWLTNIRRVSHSLFDLFQRIRRNQARLDELGLGDLVFVGNRNGNGIVKTEPDDISMSPDEAPSTAFARYDFNIADPFWYTQPENVPLAMSSPRDSRRARDWTGEDAADLNSRALYILKGEPEPMWDCQLEDIMEIAPNENKGK